MVEQGNTSETQKQESVLTVRNLTVSYGDRVAVRDLSMEILRSSVTAIIGPSGAGKSTLLRALDRMLDPDGMVGRQGRPTVQGEIIYHDDGSEMDICDDSIDLSLVRRTIGMVFQKPNPFPKSIYENIAFAPRVHGTRGVEMDQIVEEALRRAHLWDEVKDRLRSSSLSLSGGQQQRLCIARALAVKPSILLMDEPCSALHPRATLQIEDAIGELAKDHTIVIVTHNIEQARRVSTQTAYLGYRPTGGELVEIGPSAQIFINPREKETEQFIAGKIG